MTELIEAMAAFMGWQKKYDGHPLNKEHWWWVDNEGKFVKNATWNPTSNPADCAGLMEKCDKHERSWMIHSSGTRRARSFHAHVEGGTFCRANTWTRAFCLAVKAAWEAR